MAEYNLGRAEGEIVIDASGAQSGVRDANKAIDEFDRKSMSAGDGLFKLSAGLLAVGTAGVAAFGFAIKTAADFEAQLSGIKAVTGATEAQMEALRKKALQLGADTVFSASESASAMEELSKAGISVEDILNGAADATVNLAAAGGTDLPTAATIAANAMNQFGLAGQDMARVADLIAGSANASSIDVNDFGMSLAQSGATANLIGLSFDDLALAITAMGQAGVKGSDAGTSIKTFLQNLQPVTQKQIDLFKDLGLTQDSLITQANPLGNAFFDSTGSIKSMSEIAGTLQTSLEGMSDAQKTATLEAIFGTDAIRAAAIIADQGASGFDTLAAAMGGISAADVAATRMDNFKGSVEKLKGTFDSVLITIGDLFLPMLRNVVDFLDDVLQKFLDLNPETQKWAAYIAAAATALATLLGAVGVAAHVMSPMTAAIKAMTIAFSESTVALLASPIFWIVAIIVAIAVAFYLAYTRIQGFRDAVDQAVDKIVAFGKMVQEWIQNTAIPALKEFGEFFMKEVYPRIVDFVKSTVKIVQAIVDFIVQDVVPVVVDAWNKIVELAIAAWNWFNENVVSTLNAILEFIIAVWDRVWQITSILLDQMIFTWNLLWPVIETVFRIVMDIIGGAMQAIGLIIGSAITAIQTAWALFGDNIISAIKIAFDVIKTIVETVLGIIRGVFQVLTGLITLDWDKFWEGIKTIVDTIWQAIQDAIKIQLEAIKLVIQSAIDAIKLAWKLFWDGVKLVVDLIWIGIQTAVQTGLDLIKGIIDTTINAIKTIWATAWDAVLSKVTIIWDTIKSFVDAGINFVKDRIIAPVLGAISLLWSNSWSAIKDTVSSIFDGIKASIDRVIGAIKDAIDKALGWISDAWQKTKDFISGGLNPFGDIPGVPFLAKGGILMQRTLAVVGEAGPEAVIPLNDPTRALELLNTSGLSSLVLAGLNGPNPVQDTGSAAPLAVQGSGDMIGVHIENAIFEDGVDVRTVLVESEMALQGMRF